MEPAAAVVFFADGATAVAAGFNSAWLVGHWRGGAAAGDRRSRLRPYADNRPRRLAAVTLALLNAGIAVQAAFGQALFSAHRLGMPVEPLFEPAPWVAARLPLLAGTLLLSLLILRRVR
ncbi:MAG: hypothetical protein EPO22_05665 [Dehalococcoidia bacterium]|nr:MAG: hypothetical protein EPO22_05665 [Dehalococcoidia bacterium]